ncbi:MAG: alpha/beta fold hydrolase [Planctomycetes bacterium]|nr:alpha/beta fold hydrolase [Planctomycetota bacterium]
MAGRLTRGIRRRHASQGILALLALLLFATAADAQKLGEVEKRRPEARAPRAQVLEWRSKADRPYWYRLPEKGKESGSLLLMLHGTGVPHGWAFWNYPIGDGSFRPGDVVVAPEGVTPGQGESFNFIQGDKDGDQLVEIIRLFREEFPIERVYVYGHSQGAFFSYWFAGRHPELIDGIVAHAGNLLANVSHPQLARDKVAITILHGRADAVVPVDCAIASEKALREIGYRKLKLEIVEGLTEQSGHWPLPGPVARLLDWLDQVSVADPAAALEIYEKALALEAPNLDDLTAFAARADALVGKHRGADHEELVRRLETARNDHDAALSRLVATLAELDPKAKEDGELAALFRLAAEKLAQHDGARKELRALLAAWRGETKEVTKCLDLVSRKRDAKSLEAAAKVLGRRFLAPERGELLRLVGRLLDPCPEGLARPTQARLAELVTRDLELRTAAEKRLAELLRRPTIGR